MSPKSSYPAEAAVAMQATPDSSAVAFQIQYRNLAGHHRTLDDVCADQLVGSQLKRIASKEGIIWEEAAATLRLVKAGKELDRSAPCGLEKGDSVHLLLRSLPGGMDGAAHWQVWGKPIAPLPSPTPSIPHPLTPPPTLPHCSSISLLLLVPAPTPKTLPRPSPTSLARQTGVCPFSCNFAPHKLNCTSCHGVLKRCPLLHLAWQHTSRKLRACRVFGPGRRKFQRERIAATSPSGFIHSPFAR